MSRRRICVVTGNRADYGLLSGLMREIQGRPSLELCTIVTGAHLSPEFGNTHREIENDGFRIDAKVEMDLAGDRPDQVARATAHCLEGMTNALVKLQPDLVVVLGDRVEILAATTAAVILCIPIAHIHGGEASEGVIDEAIRHAITKFSHLHFVAAEPYRLRVLQMGEAPERVANVGALGYDNICRMSFPSRSELAAKLELDLNRPLFLVTYHPVTLDPVATRRELGALLNAFAQFPQAAIVVTGVNPDAGHSIVATCIDEFARAHGDRVLVKKSLGQALYLSAMKHAQVVIGNSSSGMIEAPMMKIPTVNIGNRQKGRLRLPSIIDAEGDTAQIVLALRRTADPEFIAALETMSNPYGEGQAARKIADTLESVELSELLQKSFHTFDASLRATV